MQKKTIIRILIIIVCIFSLTNHQVDASKTKKVQTYYKGKKIKSLKITKYYSKKKIKSILYQTYDKKGKMKNKQFQTFHKNGKKKYHQKYKFIKGKLDKNATLSEEFFTSKGKRSETRNFKYYKRNKKHLTKQIKYYASKYIITYYKNGKVNYRNHINNKNKKVILKEIYSTKCKKWLNSKQYPHCSISAGSALEKQHLSYINNLRKQHGKKPLTLNPKLLKAAQIRTKEMIQHNKYSHTRPNGKDCFSVFNEVGYKFKAAGENIAKGGQDLSASAIQKHMYQQWQNSSAHKSTMIDGDFDEVGVAIIKDSKGLYWGTQVFGKD